MKPIFNTLEFDGINSLEQGVFITGESVYNAPERDVESVEIAGRSGDYLLDKGRWKNIDVTYTCGCFGEDQDEFAKKIRNFRNLLASRYGYHRLVDSYNPEEYRLGVFKNPVEVDSQSMKRAGEFDVTFNCKPQRYLMSGETEQAVTSGEKLYNPTPFDSNPLLAVKGYGTIEFNGYTIELRNETLGDITPESGDYRNSSGRYVYTKTFPDNVLNTGDPIIISDIGCAAEFSNFTNQYFFKYPISVLPTNTQTEASTTIKDNSTAGISARARLTTVFSPITLSAGESQTWTNTTNWVNVPVVDQNETQAGTISAQMVTTITYTATAGNGGVVEITYNASITAGSTYMGTTGESGSAGTAKGESSVSLIGDPTYIDCDLGDAYMIKDGTYVGLNKYIDLGSDLPTFASGNNEITFDNTVTELKITPRWWIL